MLTCLIFVIGFYKPIIGQIVYTDVIPDTTVYLSKTTGTIFYTFDLDNNGIMDFYFQTENWDTISGGQHLVGKAITLQAMSTLNKVTGGCWAGNNNFLYAGDTIKADLTWNDRRYLKYYANNVPWDCGIEMNDVIFGLKFEVNSFLYYGWVRCDATDTSVTIKDYAYNSSPNSYILASQTIGGIDTDSLNSLIHIYSDLNTLIADFADFNAQGTINILNLLGQTQQTASINGNHNVILLNNLKQGVYIISIHTPQIIVNKKVFLN